MRRIVIAVLSITLFLGTFVYVPTTSYSQSFSSYSQAFEDYSLAVEGYKRVHDDYVLARSQFLRFQTLTSQNNAKEATAKLLEKRDDVIIKYLTALKEKITDTEGVPDATREGLFFRIDEEISWFSDHMGRVSSAGSLDDLVLDSNEAKKRFEQADSLIYESLSLISVGRLNNFRDRLEATFSQLREKVNQIRDEDRSEYKFSTRKLERIDRWIFETENRITRSNEKQQEVDKLMVRFGEQRKNNSGLYNSVLVGLGESQQYLEEASLFVKEIIREIETAE
ncbi:MAG: hypothetical protein ACC618_02705 [Patescibacteria group bacterium]